MRNFCQIFWLDFVELRLPLLYIQLTVVTVPVVTDWSNLVPTIRQPNDGNEIAQKWSKNILDNWNDNKKTNLRNWIIKYMISRISTIYLQNVKTSKLSKRLLMIPRSNLYSHQSTIFSFHYMNIICSIISNIILEPL